MDSDYMFLCGVMWCRFGQQDAGKELLRAATSMDAEMRALARAMWAKGALRLRMRSCALCEALLHKVRLCDSVCCQCGWIW